MKFTIVLATAALATALNLPRDTSEYLKAFEEITSATTAVGTSLETFTGDEESLGSLLSSSNALIDSLNAGVTAATNAAPLTTIDEAYELLAPDQKLYGAVNVTVDRLIEKQSVITDVGLTPVLLDQLKLIQDGAVNFHETVVSKVPEEVQEIADDQGKPILAQIQRAIDIFEGGSAPSPTGSGDAPAVSSAAPSQSSSVPAQSEAEQPAVTEKPQQTMPVSSMLSTRMESTDMFTGAAAPTQVAAFGFPIMAMVGFIAVL